MKKLFAMVALATFFTACNNGSEEKKAEEVIKDSANSESPLMDAVSTQDSVTKKIEDSTHQMVDTMMKK